jgi:ubiquinone biosynthesis protein
LCIEFFEGESFSSIVSGKKKLPAKVRSKLAKKMLKELLIQIFEIGLFHADPHAGNLILLEDGSVGIFDWGLAGELSDTDRKHIAGVLRSVIGLDMDGLIEVLQDMARDGGRGEIPVKKIRKELKKVITLAKKGRTDDQPKAKLNELLDAALSSADRLDIPVPSGLLMMAKSLVTVEGLAKGLDPNVSMKMIATPVLFRAAQPRLKDLFSMGKKIVEKTFKS